MQIKDTLSVLRGFFEDEEVNEIMINASDDVFISRQGKDFRAPVKLSAGEISAAITLIASVVAKEVGDKSGNRLLDARLPGFRVSAMLPPVAVNGPSMCIRRHAARVFTVDELVGNGVVSEPHMTVIADAVRSRKNFLIVGGTSSGKTTLMNTVLSLIPRDERLFVIEDPHELQITADNHVVIECDPEQGVTPRRAVKAALRYAPKRIILGEMRGGEAFDWADAANTGHPGSGATIHANSANRALPRLENLMLQADMGIPYASVQANIGETVQLMVYIEKDGATRRVSQVSRLHGFDRAKGEYEIETI
jgi:pilus assembly protein CpaF